MPPELPPRLHSTATPALPADGKRSKQEEGSARLADANDAAPAWAPLLSMVPGLRLMVGLVIAAVVILGLYVGRDLLLPLALAALLGFLLDPAVSRLKRWGLPRMLAVLLVVSVALGGIGAGALYVGSQVTELSAELPTYQNTIRQKLRNLKGYFKGPSIFDGAFKVFSTVEKIDLMPFQMPEKMPLTASHAPLQLPWNRLEKTSNRPIRVSRTVPSTVDTT